MNGTFVRMGNQPIAMKASTEEVRDVEWFKDELLKRGVSALEIVWGDYKTNFAEIPSHLLGRYLHYRPLLLHKAALEAVTHEEQVQKNHLFTECE